MDKFPMTVAGYEKLEADLKKLKNEERPAVIQAIAEARAHGDLSENAEYHAAKERQGWIESQIVDLEDKYTRAQVINVEELDPECELQGLVLNQPREKGKVSYILNNSFGMLGINSVVVIKKC